MPHDDLKAEDVAPEVRGATIEMRAERRYSERERTVLMALAYEVANDLHAHPGERAVARRRLTTPALEDVDIGKLSGAELAVLDGLLAKLVGGIGDEVPVHVIADGLPCQECAARAERVYIDITDIDDRDVRESLIEGVQRYLGEQHNNENRAQRRLGDGG